MTSDAASRRKLMITVDVEAQPARAERDHIDRLIWGRFDGAESGMAQLMAIAERRGVRLTSYFDYAEQYLYGDSMVDVAREIHGRGHDLQLHLHPEFLSDDFFRKHGTRRVHSLTTVQQEDAKLLATFLCAAQREVTGRQALAFRGGGYRFSYALLRALYEQGVRLDSSYNPSRPTQPVNVGVHKQFEWQGLLFEVPVSNVFAFSNPEHYLDYNFNAQALWGRSAQDSASRHRRYLERFYGTYGDDAIAVLVLHSWSLLQRNAAGHYEYAGQGGIERFEALLESLEGYADVIDTSEAIALLQAGVVGTRQDLAAAEASRAAAEEPGRAGSAGVRRPTQPLPAPAPAMPDAKAVGAACPICGTLVQDFEDFNGPKRRCKGCGAVERQRAFAQLYRGDLGHRHPLAGQKVLLIAPSSSERRFLGELGVGQLLTADIRPEVKPDIIADVCNMTNVADETFDVVIASYVLTCVHSLELALSELKRVLKPGGLLLTSDPITRGRATREHRDEKTITDWYGKDAYEKYRVGSFRSFGDEDVLALIGGHFRCEAKVFNDVANGNEVVWIVSRKEGPLGNPAANVANVSRRRLRTAGCTVCGNDLKHVEAQQNCPECQSRARLRALVPVLEQVLPGLGPRGAAVGKPLLAFAVTNAESKRLEPSFPVRKSVSLFGNYAPEHESGVDVRDLSRYGDASFCGVFASLLFDYFEEHEAALAECFRVIAPGGVLLTHVAPYRLSDGNEAPRQSGAIKARPGSFDYLPDGQALPDVKVGREWFLNAVRAAGFEPHLVTVDDTVGLVSEWFIGVKPEQPHTARLVTSTVPAPRSASTSDYFPTRSRELFRVLVPFGHSGVSRLVLEEVLLTNGPSIMLVEDSNQVGRERQIVVTDRARREVYTSDDNGATFQRRYRDVTFPSMVRQCLTLRNGHRIIKLDLSPLTYLFDQHDQLLEIGQTGQWNWAGAQGIGEGPSGTVMFGEYAAFKKGIAMQPLSVWRRKSGAERWERSLTLDAGYAPPEGQIRHFHLCSPNPADPSQWLLSSGDKGRHNRMWTSNDDGDSWQEVSLYGMSIDGVALASLSGAARLTQINATDDGELVWGSDDKLGIGKAALMAMRLKPGAPLFRHLGFAGPNAVRNVVKLGPSLFMFLCETKEPANEAAECVLLDTRSGKRLTLALPNLSGQNSTTTDSLGSLCLRDGLGYFPAIGAVLTTSRSGILRLRFEDGEHALERVHGSSGSEENAKLPSPALGTPSVAAPAAPAARSSSLVPGPLRRPHFLCDPQLEYGLNEPTRVCFWDETRKVFARLCELQAGQRLDIPVAEVSETFDLKVKVQTRSNNGWTDNIAYRRVEIEGESLHGIRYRYFPRAGTQHLIVIFQAMNTTPGYNYLGTLKDVPASRLYIKDDYGEDSKTRSSYYLGARRSFDVAQGVRSLVQEALLDLSLRPRDLILGGSSKGAFAALFHGYGLNAGHVVAGGPQILLGKFLNSRSPASVLPPILQFLAGDSSPESVAWSDNVLFEEIASCKPPYPQVTIHVGEREPHYREHVRPLLDWLEKRGLPAPTLHLGDYALHSELDLHFPAFFREKVDGIVRSK